MIADWILETTTTTGTGTITLAGAKSNAYVAIGDRFSDGELVKYVVTNGDNREIGLGVYTASGTTLSRVTIIETLVAGVYDNTSPVAITLSGSSEVMVSSTADDTPFTIPPVSGRGYLSESIPLGDSAGESFPADELYCIPYIVQYAGFYDAFKFRIVATGTATKARIGLWEMKGDGTPGKLLVETADIGVAATGEQIITFTSRELKRAQYFIGFLLNGTCSVDAANYRQANCSILGATTLYSTSNNGYATQGVTTGWTVLPTITSFGTPNSANFNILIGMRAT